MVIHYILTSNIFVDPILDNFSYLFFIVFLVQLQFVPEVDVTVSRHERGGKKADDEQIPHEPEIGSHIVLVPAITVDVFSQRYKVCQYLNTFWITYPRKNAMM